MDAASDCQTREDGLSSLPLQTLPDNVLSLVIGQATDGWNVKDCFRLRLVCHYFDQEILREAFGLFKINRLLSVSGLSRTKVDDLVAYRYWVAFCGCRDPVRSLMLDAKDRVYDELDVTRFGPYVTEQIKRLRTIHSSLSQAVDIFCGLRAFKYDDASGRRRTYEVGVQQRTQPNISRSGADTVCKAAICLFGPKAAWAFVHHEPRTPNFELYRAGAGGYSKERLCSRALSTKDAAFWATLAVVYTGDLECLRSRLDLVKIKHNDTSQWLDRMATNYYQFCEDCSSAEQYWIDLLSACLTIAVRRRHEDVVCYLLAQDLATSLEVFQSLNFNADLLLASAVQSCSVVILDALLKNRWLQPSANWIQKVRYETALVEAANLDQQCPNRDEIVLRLLRISSQWKSSLRIILTAAAKRNDVGLVEIIISVLGKCNVVNEGLDTFVGPTTIPARTVNHNDKGPLGVAACLGHMEIIRCFLKHAKELRVGEIVFDDITVADPRTEVIMHLMNQDQSSDMAFMTELLDQTKHLRLEQLQLLMWTGLGGIKTLHRFLQHVDVHGPAFPGDDITLGEHGLISAVFSINISCIDYLIKTHKVKVTRPIVLVPYRKAQGENGHWLATLKVSATRSQDAVRAYLTDHGIAVNADRTVIWPRHLELSIPSSTYSRSAITGLDRVDDRTCWELGWKIWQGRGRF